jgi:acyl-CoA hydrolase
MNQHQRIFQPARTFARYFATAYRGNKIPKHVTPAEAVQQIKSGDRVFVHTGAMAPQSLLTAMTNRHSELKGVEICGLHTLGTAAYLDYPESFRGRFFFTGANTRKSVQSGQSSYIPIFLSEIPSLFASGEFPLDVALIQVSPPDKHGYCSLGVSVDVSQTATQNAKIVIAQINPRCPRTHGDGLIHLSRIDLLTDVPDDEDIGIAAAEPLDEIDHKIGKNVAQLIENGSTLQMGIGSIPDAVLAEMGGHQDLGIHTEMFSEGVLDLVEAGVITGALKKHSRNIMVSSFLIGSRRLYDFVDDNPMVRLLKSDEVNNPGNISQNPRVVAINSALEIDLTGQICADSIGARIYSGVGGQMDFMRGAALSRGGKPIIAMRSTTPKGKSKIVPMLTPGSGVVTTRAHTRYVVTEHGVAYLWGKDLAQRIDALISVAHPAYRDQLANVVASKYWQQPYATLRDVPL